MQPSSFDNIRQSLENNSMSIKTFKDIIDKQSNNMMALHHMFEKHQIENRLLKKRIEELEAEIASL